MNKLFNFKFASYGFCYFGDIDTSDRRNPRNKGNFSIAQICLIKDAALNSQLIGLNTHLNDAHIDLDSSFWAAIPKVLLNQAPLNIN